MAAGEDVRLHVAGSSSAVPRPGRANSGYVLRSPGSAIGVDFGNGVFSRVREFLSPAELDAIFISHMHADHFFDLVPLRYALRYEFERKEALPVYLPPGGITVLREVVRPLKENADFFAGVFDLREYDPGTTLQVREWRVRFALTRHYIPAYAMRFESAAGVFAFSADSAPCAALDTVATGADLFLCEAALGADGTESGSRGHLNAGEAGETAARAAVKHLVLTHYGAAAEAAALRSAAAAAYGGRITVADDGVVIPLR